MEQRDCLFPRPVRFLELTFPIGDLHEFEAVDKGDLPGRHFASLSPVVLLFLDGPGNGSDHQPA